jgi:acetyltransferase
MVKTFNESYPVQYERRFKLRNGKDVFVRPILRTDGPLLLDLFHKISQESLHLRFLRRLHDLPEDMLHRFTSVNYDSEFALVAIVQEEGRDVLIAATRMHMTLMTM